MRAAQSRVASGLGTFFRTGWARMSTFAPKLEITRTPEERLAAIKGGTQKKVQKPIEVPPPIPEKLLKNSLSAAPVHKRGAVQFFDPASEHKELVQIFPPVLAKHPLPPPDPSLPSRYAGVENAVFAIVQIRNRQFRVCPDDAVMVDHVRDTEVGDQLLLDKVLLLGSRHWSVIGRQIVEGARVYATVEEHTQTKHVRILKKRRRKHKSKRSKGHRSSVTILRINDIVYDDATSAEVAALPMAKGNGFVPSTNMIKFEHTTGPSKVGEEEDDDGFEDDDEDEDEDEEEPEFSKRGRGKICPPRGRRANAVFY